MPSFNGAGVAQWGMLMGGGGALEVAGFLIMGAVAVAGTSLLLTAFLAVVAIAAIVVGVLLIAGAFGYGPWAYHGPSSNYQMSSPFAANGSAVASGGGSGSSSAAMGC